jgi:pyrimidine operon attenuation protein/uracil phosphoribosyltransferase
MNPPLPDAEALCAALAEALRPRIAPATTALVGIHTGGVWIAERLQQLLGLHVTPGAIDVSFYRDDFSQRGLHANAKRSHIPFDVDGAHIIIVDDVLYTGRTIRAAMNELFDYGRPAKVELAVLVDRGGRELPIAADYCPHTLTLPAAQTLALERGDGGGDEGVLAFRLIEK